LRESQQVHGDIALENAEFVLLHQVVSKLTT